MAHDPAQADAVELIARLCLETGRIMEDTSVELAMSLPASTAELERRLAEVCRAGEDILALGAAAQALHRRSGRSAAGD